MTAPDGDAGGASASGLLELLSRHGMTLAVAESLTGGLVAARLTDVPGASRVLRGGVIAYATTVKRDLLGVDATLLGTRGAVDAEVACQMAEGVRRVLGADWGLSTTGVAGPDPQDGKEVGTVFVAVAGPHDRASRAHRLRLGGDRAAIRGETVREAVRLLYEELNGNPRAEVRKWTGGADVCSPE